jgi:hypothetical protein
LVKLAARLASVSTGASSSSPTSDQVPDEMNAKSVPLAGTATTAEAVSWEPTVITGTLPASSPGVESPRIVPGSTSGGRMRGTSMP